MSDDPRPTDEAAERSPRSQGVAWMLGLVGVPVVYVLTAPILAFYHPVNPASTGPLSMSSYVQPYIWIQEETYLRGPMLRYEEWCWETLARLSE